MLINESSPLGLMGLNRPAETKRYKTDTTVFKVVISSVDCSNQTAWRKSNLACKLAIDNTEKDELLHRGENQSIRQR